MPVVHPGSATVNLLVSLNFIYFGFVYFDHYLFCHLSTFLVYVLELYHLS